MIGCNVSKIVPDLDAVSRECKTSTFCKSKIQPDGTFIVETTPRSPECKRGDPRKVWMSLGVTEKNKFSALDDLLDKSGFHEAVKDRCGSKKKCKIYVKTNFAPTTQREFKGYTDPELVEHVAGILEKQGHDVTIFENETKLADVSPVFYPEILAKRLDPPYKRPVANLTREARQLVTWKSGSIEISRPLVEADMIISMAKIKTISEYYVSIALKNMYGAIPDRDKYHLFHWQDSGFDVEDATLVSNHSTGVDFSIAEGIVTEDGGKTSSMHASIEKDHFNAGAMMAGKDPLAIDKLASIKTGIGQNKSSITRRESAFRGDFDITSDPGLVEVIGKPDAATEEKFARFWDMKTGGLWKKPIGFEHFAFNSFQFITPRVLGIPDRTMKIGMCAFAPNFTVMTREEREEACKIEKLLPLPPSNDWT
jgi:uncharacterized protein (DUF362 family)